MSQAKFSIGQTIQIKSPDNPTTYLNLLTLEGQVGIVSDIIGSTNITNEVLEDSPLYYIKFPHLEKKTVVPEKWLK
jgi:hypothetical protein